MSSCAPVADGFSPEEREALFDLLAEKGRVALLAHLRSLGVTTVGSRQRIANELGRLARLRKPPELPLVFIHIGYQAYVEAAVRATALVHRPIVVLGDVSMSCLGEIEGVEFVDVSAWRNEPDIERARRVYVHRSSNGAAYESFCFERIFLLRRFLTSRNLERAFHLDSDCVLLEPLDSFPLHLHRVWLVFNNFYHLHGFSPLPSASIHASLLDVMASAADTQCHHLTCHCMRARSSHTLSWRGVCVHCGHAAGWLLREV